MALQFVKLFNPSQLAGAAATIYTVPAAPASTVLRNGRLELCNTDSSAHACTLYAVPNAGTASNTNTFLSAFSVAPNSSIQVDVPQMAAGDFIQGFADSASKVSVHAMDGVLQS